MSLLLLNEISFDCLFKFKKNTHPFNNHNEKEAGNSEY